MGVARKLFRFLIDIAVVSAILLFVPGVPPYGKFDVIPVTPPRRLEGALEPGEYMLSKAEKLFEGQLVGPECLEPSPVDPDVFYTTLQGGAIVKISNNGQTLEPVAKFGDKCQGLWDAENCGRPLGIRFDSNGHLIAADSYLGIFKIDFEKSNCSSLKSLSNSLNLHFIIQEKPQTWCQKMLLLLAKLPRFSIVLPQPKMAKFISQSPAQTTHCMKDLERCMESHLAD